MYNLLKRTKLDANREINEATLNIPDAITLICKANLAISGRGLLLDIHGQVHTPQRTELGYHISKFQLVDRSYKIASTSIRSLEGYWCESNDVCFQDVVQGIRSLGHFTNHGGLAAVPSPLDERDGGEIDAIQLEFPKEFRSAWSSEPDAQHNMANAIVELFQLNYEM